MSVLKRQVITDAIDLLVAQTRLPLQFEGKKLYGETVEDENDPRPDCKVYKLSNETGTGRITVYQVFTGIELYYNDIHMAYCGRNQAAAKNMIEINHCRIGRYECGFGENSCCYMAAGDLSVSSAMKKKSFSSFPLSHYHGITIVIVPDQLLPEARQIMELLSIDLSHIQKYICEDHRLCIMRANPSIEHIFSELYHVQEQRKPGYMKIKILELLLFLSDLDQEKEVIRTDYYNQNQVRLIKEVAAFITEDLSRHYTIGQLSKRFGISETTLKKCFRGVYGTSVYAWLRAYRLQTAQKLLIETNLKIAEIASRIGYENPNKFTSAFRSEYGMPPTAYKKECLNG